MLKLINFYHPSSLYTMAMNTQNPPTQGFYELKVYVTDSKLSQELKQNIDAHNQSFSQNSLPDSGFDLPTPQEITVKTGTSEKINLSVKCILVYNTYDSSTPKPYYIYPRSSTGSKTPLRLANSVGIIDAGYRGNLMTVFDNISNIDYKIAQHQRLVQICTPTLEPFLVSLHTDETQLDGTTRGEGGFGSTGK